MKKLALILLACATIGHTALAQSNVRIVWVPATDSSTFSDLGANATRNVKATPGSVFSLTCYNANAADRYLQLHNTATTPSGGAAPALVFLVPAGGQIVIGSDYFTDVGMGFTTGIAFAFSTTRNTYTAATAAEQTTFIRYK